jgi:hypothetical protein
MNEKDKISRRRFLANTSAVVGASAITGATGGEQKPATVSQPPPQFTSAAGSVIPFTERELMAIGSVRSFTGAQLGEIAFPLGGIGTGTVSLGGRGDLRDWEIFNRPN